MKINRMSAVVISLVLVLGGSFAKAKVTFSSLQNRLDTQFVEGTDHDGYSIASDIEAKINIVKNTITVADRVQGLDEDVIMEAKEAVETLENSSKINDVAERESRMDTALNHLLDKMEAAGISEKDRNYIHGFKADYKAADHRIKLDPYHEMVIETEKKTSGALAGILKTLTFSSVDVYRTGGR